MKQTDSNDGRRGDTYGGFYFVRVIKPYSESLLLNGTILGVICFAPLTFEKHGTGGEENQFTPNIVTFSVSVLVVVTNKAEPAIQLLGRVPLLGAQTLATIAAMCPAKGVSLLLLLLLLVS